MADLYGMLFMSIIAVIVIVESIMYWRAIDKISKENQRLSLEFKIWSNNFAALSDLSLKMFQLLKSLNDDVTVLNDEVAALNDEVIKQDKGTNE